MMQLWMKSSKDEMTVSAKYNAENEKECNEVSEKIWHCISLWTCITAAPNYGTDDDAVKHGIPVDSVPSVEIKFDPLNDCERDIKRLKKSLRDAIISVANKDDEIPT